MTKQKNSPASAAPAKSGKPSEKSAPSSDKVATPSRPNTSSMDKSHLKTSMDRINRYQSYLQSRR